jgi:hypothetical protein
MPKLFLSYRRADSAAITGRVRDRLRILYGPESVFMDVDDIPIGVDFKKRIATGFTESDLVLVMIGTRWLGDPGAAPRIKSEKDPVRMEVEAALAASLPVIPVVVDGAKMPDRGDLPETLKGLADLNAAYVISGRDFDFQMDRLTKSIDRLLAERGKTFASTGSSTVSAAGGGRTDRTTAAARSPLPLLAASKYLIALITLVVLAHYLISMKFNMSNIYLQSAAILIPLTIGFHIRRSGELGFVETTIFGIIAGAVSVLWMFAVVGVVDGRALIPANAFEWQEAGDYFASIMLSLLAGNVLARAAKSLFG